MDYNYLPPEDRQEGRPAPENGRGHPQNQYPVHCEHQQYPTGHQVTSTGYPSLGFGSFIHPIQALITSTSPGMSSQESLQPPRMAVQDSTGSGSSTGMPFRTESQQHLQHVLHPVANQPHLMQSDGAFHVDRSAIIQNDPGHPSRTSSGHSSHSVSSAVHHGRRQQPMEAGPLNPDGGFHMNHPIVTQPIMTHNAPPQTSAPSRAAISAPSQVPSVPRPLETSSASGPVAPLSASGPVAPLSASVINTKSCQTVPLFEIPPVAARTLTSSFDLLEGFSYKMTGEDTSPGVVVTKDLQAGEEFGPFTGEFVGDECGIIDPTSWEVCVRGKTGLYMSGTCDPNNWMTHVQMARSKEEQNMEAFQFYGDIFFRTTKAVEAGTELRVFYSKDYCKKVGFRMGLEELILERGSGRFKCRDCENRYSNAKSLLRHIKFEHDKENSPITSRTRDEESGAPAGRSILSMKQEKAFGSGKGSTSVVSTSKGEDKRKTVMSTDLSKHLQMTFVPPKVRESRVRLKEMETKNQFACNLCQKQFPSEGQLEAHTAFHKGVRAFTRSCSTCGMLCTNMTVLRQHEISHDPNAFQCHMCQRYFRRKKDIVYHLRHDHKAFEGKEWSKGAVEDLMRTLRVSQDQEEQQKDDKKKSKSAGKKRKKKKKNPNSADGNQDLDDREDLEEDECELKTFKCQYCDKVFHKNSHRVAHLREEHKIYIWKQYSLKMEERLSRLIRPEEEVEDPSFHPDLPVDMLGKQIARPVTRPRIYKCKYCPKRFTGYYGCRKHEKQVHTYTGNFICEFCSNVFVSETAYIMHKTKHTRDRLYKCEECPLSFGSESALERHVREHRGEFPHKCDVCTKGFGNRKLMLAHKRRTHRVPSVLYQCQYCPRKLKDKGTLRNHEKCHKGIRPYVCLTCSKAFRDSYSLKCHTLTHTGEKPHECKECQKRFRVSHQLFQHMIIHHNKEKRQEAITGINMPSSSGATSQQIGPSTSGILDE